MVLSSRCVVSALVTLPLIGCAGLQDDAAFDELLAAFGEATVTVFPTALRTDEIDYDHDSRAELANQWTSNGWAASTVLADEEVSLSAAWQSNQMTMAGESMNSFADHLSENPIETDYAFLAECLFLAGPSDGELGGVHTFVLRDDGVGAAVEVVNESHEVWPDDTPDSTEDCIDLIQVTLVAEFDEAARL